MKKYKMFLYCLLSLFGLVAIVMTGFSFYKTNEKINNAIMLGDEFYNLTIGDESLTYDLKVAKLKELANYNDFYGVLAKFKLASFMSNVSDYKEALKIYKSLRSTLKNNALMQFSEYMYMLTLFKAEDFSELEHEFSSYNNQTENKDYYGSIKHLEAVFYALNGKKEDSKKVLFEMAHSGDTTLSSKYTLRTATNVVDILSLSN